MKKPLHQLYLQGEKHGKGNKDGKDPDEIQVGGTHYKDMVMQPWDVMESVLTRAEFIGFLKGNLLKYTMRAGRKAGSDDAAKALHYRDKLAQVMVRAASTARNGRYNHDDYVDGAAYAALGAECASKA